MEIKKVLLILMAGFVVSGAIVAAAKGTGGAKTNMVSRAEADHMVDEAVKQAEIDIRRELDKKDADAAKEDAKEEKKSSTKEKTTEEENTEEETTAEEPSVTKEEPKEETTTEEAVVDPDRKIYKYTVVARNLHKRSGPSVDTPVLGILKKGSTGYVIDPGESFSLCKIGDEYAFLSNKYLKMEEVDPSEVPEEIRSTSPEKIAADLLAANPSQDEASAEEVTESHIEE